MQASAGVDFIGVGDFALYGAACLCCGSMMNPKIG